MVAAELRLRIYIRPLCFCFVISNLRNSGVDCKQILNNITHLNTTCKYTAPQTITNAFRFQIVLSSNELIQKSNDYETLEPWLGKGLLTNGGSSWHQQRKLLTPAFHFNILGTFRTPMEECCTILVHKLSAVADGKQTVDVYPYVSLFSLDVICGIGLFANIKIDILIHILL